MHTLQDETAARSVWITEVGVQDTQFYAGGTENTVTVHATRDGAARSLREQFLRLGAPITAVVNVGIDHDSGNYTESHDAEWADAAADDYEDDDVRFKYSWSIRQQPVSS